MRRWWLWHSVPECPTASRRQSLPALPVQSEARRKSSRGVRFGGRVVPQWWPHLEFTRISIELIILGKKIEDLCEAGASGVVSLQL